MSSLLAQPGGATKRVSCTHCAQNMDVAVRAMSVFCPHCNKRLILEDFKIDSYYAVREFSTCGDVVIEKKGHVVAPIKAGNLTVKGKVQGNATVRGQVEIKKSGWFKGDLEAPCLLVEDGAVLEAFVRIGPPHVPA